MSEHAWTLENVAAFVAGGLDGDEGQRLERHAAECPECAAALREARALDRGLDALFAVGRPGPALEDQMIDSLRREAERRALRTRWRRKLAFGAAAAVALGVTGAGMSRLVADNELLFPGAPRPQSEAEAYRVYQAEGYMPGSPGIQGPEEMARAIGDRAKISGGQPDRHLDSAKTIVSGQPAQERNIAKSTAIAPIPPGFSSAGIMVSMGDARTASPPSQPPPDPKSPGTPQDDSYGGSGNAPPPSETHFKPGEIAPKPQAPADPKPPPKEGKEQPKPEPEPVPPPDKVKATEQPAPTKPDNPAPEAPSARKVIRSGEIEFEVESFDSALATVTKLATGIKGAFVATVNSDKQANGKIKGSIVLRVPPDSLDTLVLDLRKELGKGGELKGQRIKSEDITKQYTDLESRLKAARTMEQRLLQIIKEGKGEIKQLLEAEKELGNWRTKIEEFEGEIRYYANLVGLSTLTVTLTEKEFRAAADVVESEHVQAGIEVEDVDRAQREALAAVADAKGRVTRSELKQHSAGQYAAVLQFEVAPEAAGPLRDRLKQLGNMARLEIDRVQKAEGGSAPPPRDAKVRRGDTHFDVQMYNLTKVEARETATLRLAVADVPAGYRALRDAVERAKGRVVTAQLNEQNRQNPTAQLDFEVRRADEAVVQAALTAAGDLLSRQVNRPPETKDMTDAKILYRASLVSAAAVPPRETVTLGIEVADVDATAAVFAAQVAEAQGRVVDNQEGHERSGRVTFRLVYDVPLSAAAGLVERFKGAGTVRAQQSVRNPQAADGKLARARLDVVLSNSELIVPKDEGLWPQVRKGLSYSVMFLSFSVTWLIFGLCVLLPWALVGYGGYRVVRRLFGSPPAPVPVAAAATPVAPPPAS